MPPLIINPGDANESTHSALDRCACMLLLFYFYRYYYYKRMLLVSKTVRPVLFFEKMSRSRYKTSSLLRMRISSRRTEMINYVDRHVNPLCQPIITAELLYSL